ncbi:hypothetical protein [uncultured Eubacterium sp.]|uniref:hypothetical protein n=1 Tax=uncultured Eubacterium sp. TaxID=165185 RepID=UPI000E87816D|nr:hypothetical protein [uncultured Eubacterium sp.]HAV89750.1 hypothetical protein [Eubacterium sp.]
MSKSSTKLFNKKPTKNQLNNAYGQNNTTNTFNTTKSISTYKPGKNVTNAYSALQNQMKNQPKFNSAYTQEMANAYNNYKNRPNFEYDMNKDALYQQYAKQYKALGNTAMQDTMGQAAQLSGGFGNSYAAAAGQQAYNQYMQQLNDKVPELYAQARDVYNQEGQDLLNQYDLAQQMYTRDYGKYRDLVADNNDKINQLYQIYSTNAGNDLDQYKQMSANNQFALDYNLSKQNQAFNQKMQKLQYDLDRRKADADIEATRAASAAKILGASSKGSGRSTSVKDLPNDVYKRLENFGYGNSSDDSKFTAYLEQLEDRGLISRKEGQNLYNIYWGNYDPESELEQQLRKEGSQSSSYAIDNHLKNLVAQGTLTQAQANAYYKKYHK